MGKKTVEIRSGEQFMTLNVLLKLTNEISTGGQAKIFLRENEIYVNEEKENRRGRKLYSGDLVKVNSHEYELK